MLRIIVIHFVPILDSFSVLEDCLIQDGCSP